MADPSHLAGVHWYSDDTASTDVEALLSGNPGWVVDQALLNSDSTVATGNPWETPWQTSPVVNKSVPFFKPGYTQATTARGHTMIIRLQPQWSTNVPHGSDPYTVAAFAADCKAAAALMPNTHIWQIGNEANLRGEMNRWNTTTQAYSIPWNSADLATAPEQYAALYLACRDKIHEVTPATTPSTQIVLMQPNSPGGKTADRYLSSEEFLARMIAAVADKSKIDGFALHAYADPGTGDEGADGFMNQLRRQIAVIDQFGLGDQPIYITEFNRHMPDTSQANAAARFIPLAFSAMDEWNAGANPTWPASGSAAVNHGIAAAAWFVYRYDAGAWKDYSLAYWKTAVADQSPTQNPWYSFQSAAAQGYLSKQGTGPALQHDDSWWSDNFDGSSIDSQWPLPKWQTVAPAGSTVHATGGSVIIQTPATGFNLAGIRHSDVAFTNCFMELEFSLIDAAAVSPGERNFEFRFAQEGPDGPGYSLTFFPGTAGAGKIALRRTTTWEVLREIQPSVAVTSGDSFIVRVWQNVNGAEIQVRKKSDVSPIVNWTGADRVATPEFCAGGIGMWTYNMKQVAIQHFYMGGRDMVPVSRVGNWALY